MSQPVLSPGSEGRSKPNRASSRSVRCDRSRRLRADSAGPSSLRDAPPSAATPGAAVGCHCRRPLPRPVLTSPLRDRGRRRRRSARRAPRPPAAASRPPPREEFGALAPGSRENREAPPPPRRAAPIRALPFSPPANHGAPRPWRAPPVARPAPGAPGPWRASFSLPLRCRWFSAARSRSLLGSSSAARWPRG